MKKNNKKFNYINYFEGYWQNLMYLDFNISKLKYALNKFDNNILAEEKTDGFGVDVNSDKGKSRYTKEEFTEMGLKTAERIRKMDTKTFANAILPDPSTLLIVTLLNLGSLLSNKSISDRRLCINELEFDFPALIIFYYYYNIYIQYMK